MDPSSIHLCKAVFPDYDWSMGGDCGQRNGAEVLVGTGDCRIQVYMSRTVGVYIEGDTLLSSLGHAKQYAEKLNREQSR